MKLSFISSTAIQNSMRQTIRQAQNEMTDASTEATTGVYADIGVSLGSGTASSVNLTRDVTRIDSILSSNSVVNQRMTSSQTALSDMSSQAQKFMDQLVALRGNSDDSSIQLTQQTATATMSSFVADANTMVNGEYLFAGTNTDVQPMTDNSTAATTAIQSALSDYATAQGVAISDLTGDQMKDFITNVAEPLVTSDSSWSDWSSASDQNMSSRISNSEVIESSTNANATGMRYLALSTTVANALMGQGLSQDALNAVTDQATSYARQAIDGLNNQASQLGLSQARLTDANTSLNAQKTIINTNISDLTGVDAYEASTKVNSLQTQLETAYTIVSKIQQLSLVNYL
ncbi:flagellar hook-associated family protein [Agrobacterium rhizogenes]|uniref:flagellar hook-associated family protein n=1 Tax=Rhizobium rhizogenes TaxID=359 RepID=UPI0004D6142B|nr:flagellar hook-associated family protein [Rhizobium rhizogenes]OCJ26722.1 flagellar biosynthesis protein FlgL [Agrobacterium sp. B133/95]KEA05274.1 flagellar hook protein FlgL [Rhizobium rhizogenes]MQB33458.1 flagellar hook-associated family protein [Rhizobium rhizogenes]NTG72476.1 flagellar hook-associated family protein [Rhizobium rhizogenes]NTG85172.1 flagellar hook-associated family protein [Rhizobium rhizogenes]